MLRTKSFLCHLLLLAGCNYRVQHNSLPRDSPSLDYNLSLQAALAYVRDPLLESLFTQITKHFDLNTLIKPREGGYA